MAHIVLHARESLGARVGPERGAAGTGRHGGFQESPLVVAVVVVVVVVAITGHAAGVG